MAMKDENCYLIWLRNVRRGRSYSLDVSDGGFRAMEMVV